MLMAVALSVYSFDASDRLFLSFYITVVNGSTFYIFHISDVSVNIKLFYIFSAYGRTFYHSVLLMSMTAHFTSF